jgi:hypothetical protein
MTPLQHLGYSLQKAGMQPIAAQKGNARRVGLGLALVPVGRFLPARWPQNQPALRSVNAPAAQAAVRKILADHIIPAVNAETGL